MDNATPTEVLSEKPTAPIAWQSNAELVYGSSNDLTDFATIKDARLRDVLGYRGHSVYQEDGLWYSCCKRGTPHESREDAELCCTGGFALELADEVQP